MPPVGGAAGERGGLLDDIAHFGVVAAGKVAGWLRPVGVAALVSGLIVAATAGSALLAEEEPWPIVGIVVAVLALVPAALVAWNRRRLRVLSTREEELRQELHGLVGTLQEHARATARLVHLRDELRGGGVRSLVEAGGQLREWSGARSAVRERTDALRTVFGLAGPGGLPTAVVGTVLVCLAAPAAVVLAIVLWST